jgi:peptidoglycan hydrolase CwlO-like protein
MKKILILAALLLPFTSNAQSSLPDSSGGVLATILIVIVVSLGTFLVLRQVALWYFNINKMIENQDITNHLLDKNNKLLKEQVELLKSQIELTNGKNDAEQPVIES